MSRRYDTVIFDLDGTLLTTDKILTERTKKALEAAADQGVILVPATGGSGRWCQCSAEAFWKTGADIG